MKWLDLERFGQALLPAGVQLNRVGYFTARSSGIPDPGAPQRQNVYLEALKTLTMVEVTFGQFRKREGSYPLAANKQKLARVIRTEEKGSDVNLASHLLRDAHRSDCEIAVVVSDDFDLLTPIEFAKAEFNLKQVGVASPRGNHYLARKARADFYKPIKRAVLQTCQLPDPVLLGSRAISPPPDWR